MESPPSLVACIHHVVAFMMPVPYMNYECCPLVPVGASHTGRADYPALKLTGVLPACFQVNQVKKPFSMVLDDALFRVFMVIFRVIGKTLISILTAILYVS